MAEQSNGNNNGGGRSRPNTNTGNNLPAAARRVQHQAPATNTAMMANTQQQFQSLIDELCNNNTPKRPSNQQKPLDDLPLSAELQLKYNNLFCQLIGSLNWLSVSTQPDIQPITNMLAKDSHCASKGHIHAAKRIIKYLKGTKTEGIVFSSKDRKHLNTFVKFPIDPKIITSLTDANWGPQDQSVPQKDSPPEQVDIFKSRSISGYLIWLGGPVHWISKRQLITARCVVQLKLKSIPLMNVLKI